MFLFFGFFKYEGYDGLVELGLEPKREYIEKELAVMNKLEGFILGMILAPIPILFCFVGAWFTSAVFFEEKIVIRAALSGLAAGVIIAAVFIRGWVRRAYTMNNKTLAAIYIFYSIILVGFCMGIPILNFPWGMMAGVYIARKMYLAKADKNEIDKNIRKASVLTASAMAVLCCLMVLIAILGNVGPDSFNEFFRGVFGVNVKITLTEFSLMIFLGACTMVLVQYGLTKASAKMVLKVCE